MPRCVRNFWLKVQIDGRRQIWAGGPRTACGGFLLEVFSRNHGDVGRPLRLIGRRIADRLVLDLEEGGMNVFHKEHDR